MEYFSDIDINLETATDGDIKKSINTDAVGNAIVNILSTFQGSRRMLPDFALNVYSLLFDPIDQITAYSIGEEILSAIKNWDDRIIIEEVKCVPKYDMNQYNITINYRIKEIHEDFKQIDYILYKL